MYVYVYLLCCKFQTDNNFKNRFLNKAHLNISLLFANITCLCFLTIIDLITYII